MVSPDDKLPSLEDLQHKIDEAKPEGDEEKPVSGDIGTAMRLGTELMAGVGVGGVIGYVIDSVFDTLPIFFILFFFLGFAAGVRNITRGMSK